MERRRGMVWYGMAWHGSLGESGCHELGESGTWKRKGVWRNQPTCGSFYRQGDICLVESNAGHARSSNDDDDDDDGRQHHERSHPWYSAGRAGSLVFPGHSTAIDGTFFLCICSPVPIHSSSSKQCENRNHKRNRFRIPNTACSIAHSRCSTYPPFRGPTPPTNIGCLFSPPAQQPTCLHLVTQKRKKKKGKRKKEKEKEHRWNKLERESVSRSSKITSMHGTSRCSLHTHEASYPPPTSICTYGLAYSSYSMYLVARQSPTDLSLRVRVHKQVGTGMVLFYFIFWAQELNFIKKATGPSPPPPPPPSQYSTTMSLP